MPHVQGVVDAEEHRALRVEAARRGISLTRLVSSEMARVARASSEEGKP